MTNSIAIWLGCVIVVIFAADALWFDWNLPVVLGRLFIDLLHWLAFWR